MRPPATALYAALAATVYAGSVHAADVPGASPAIEGELTPDLRAAVARALLNVGGVSQSRFEARRRAREAGEAVIAVLRSEGYYSHQVEADVAESASGASQPVVRIAPGSRFSIVQPQVVWAEPPPEAGAAAMAFNAMRLSRGAPGRAEEVLAAEGRMVAVLQLQGYADAAANPREVIADHADHSLQPTYNIAAGPKVLLGAVQVSTRGRTNPAWAARLAPWKLGQVYAPDRLAELERRLRETGVFDQVSVALQPAALSPPGEPRPVIVSLADRAPRTIELGAGYSTSEGAGLDARFVRYNQLRRADTLTFTGRLAEIEQKLDGEIALPQWLGDQQTLKAGASIYRANTNAYDEIGVGTRIDLTRRYGRTSYRTLGASVDLTHARQKSATAGGVVVGEGSYLATIAGLAALAWDRSDDPLNPRRGWKVEARGEPTAIVGGTHELFLKTQAQGSAYLPLDQRADTVIAGRLKLGAILGGTLSGVPAPRRFFAGGGGSVRGYAYQAIGPRLPENTPRGGISLAETSLEIRRKVTQRWSAAVFVDAGAVGGTGFPQGSAFSVGAGFGVRYDLGFGPIRADVAIPLDRRQGDPAFQLYVSIGQSF